MAQLTTQKIVPAGLAPVLQAAGSGGDTWTPSSTTFLLVNNASGATVTVTVTVTLVIFGQPVQNVTVTVPDGEQLMIGTFPPAEVAGSTGQAAVTYSDATSVTVAAISI